MLNIYVAIAIFLAASKQISKNVFCIPRSGANALSDLLSLSGERERRGTRREEGRSESEGNLR